MTELERILKETLDAQTKELANASTGIRNGWIS